MKITHESKANAAFNFESTLNIVITASGQDLTEHLNFFCDVFSFSRDAATYYVTLNSVTTTQPTSELRVDNDRSWMYDYHING